MRCPVHTQSARTITSSSWTSFAVSAVWHFEMNQSIRDALVTEMKYQLCHVWSRSARDAILLNYNLFAVFICSIRFCTYDPSSCTIRTAAEEDDQQDAEEVAGGDGSGDSDENLAKIAANVSDNLMKKRRKFYFCRWWTARHGQLFFFFRFFFHLFFDCSRSTSNKNAETISFHSKFSINELLSPQHRTAIL